MHYKPTGVCSQNIEFDIEDNKVKNVHFTGGCNGNLQGIARLVEGMDVQEVIDRVEGIRCGFKATSWPGSARTSIKNSNRKVIPIAVLISYQYYFVSLSGWLFDHNSVCEGIVLLIWILHTCEMLCTHPGSNIPDPP